MKCCRWYIECLTAVLSIFLLGRNYNVWSDELTKALRKKFGDFIEEKSTQGPGQWAFYIFRNNQE